MRVPTILLLLPLIGCGNTVVDPNPNKDDQPGDDTASDLPDIDFSVTNVDFGDKHFGDRENAAVTVYNRGSAPLSVSSITVDPPFTVNPVMFDIGPAGSTTLTVTMVADAYGDFPDEITFTSDDPDEPTTTVTVHVFVISDEDGDGHDAIPAGGDDCDDSDPDTYPGAPEEWYDGIDEDCAGDDDYDQDGDGFQTSAYNDDPASGGGDCQDISAEYYPGAPDEPYDNRDTDCAGNDDYDQDGDGYRSSDYGSGTDCDDFDASVNAEGIETFNAKDDDCNGYIDDDAQAGAAAIIYDAGSTRDRAGFTVAAGDLDGDGFADAVIAGPYVDATTNNNNGRGGVGIMYGGPGLRGSGTDIDNGDVYVEGDGGTDLFGYGLSVMGDYDGDGTLDLAVGAPGVLNNAGAVYVFSGGDIDRVEEVRDAMLTVSTGTTSSYGRGVGGDLDLDGDGMHELVVAYSSGSANALSLSYGGTLSGAADASQTVQLTTDGAETAFYRNMPYGGDFDGDGYHDLLVSDGVADYGGYTDNGVLWAIFGGPSRLPTGAAVDIETVATVLSSGTESSDGAAWAVRLVPDWDGDGDDELWVYDQGEGLFVVEGGASRRDPFDAPTSATTAYAWHTNSSDAELIARAGDWTGDGKDDVLVFQEDQSGSYGDVDLFSSELQGSYEQRAGRVAHIVGSSSYDNGNAGYGLAPVNHDLDGDGDTDVLMGDPVYDTVKGQAYVFLNSPVE